MMDATVTFKSPSWALESSEEAGDVDEPPELRSASSSQKCNAFSRAAIRRPSAQSTLTKAIATNQEENTQTGARTVGNTRLRRRSITSNISIASTADLTSDTGFTSPARTNTPSPPMPEIAALRLKAAEDVTTKHGQAPTSAVQIAGQPPVTEQSAPRKRCIQFACGGNKPAAQPAQSVQAATSVAMAKAPSAQEAPRKPCIKFACPTRPASTQNTPPRQGIPTPQPSTLKIVQPTTPKKNTPTSVKTPSPRSTTPRRSTAKQLPKTRPRYLRADSSDLGTDGSQFHEFASEVSREHDWIRDPATIVKAKLTIDDTLLKENDIRRLAKEAEEEAAAEDSANDDEDDDEDPDDEDDDDEEDDEDEDEDEDEDDDDGEDTVEEFDGYSTDEETGFADSDDSADEDDENMALWTLGGSSTSGPSSQVPLPHRPGPKEQHSDSSTATTSSIKSSRRTKPCRIETDDVSDLPDSTDFVCGTLDEDKPFEEAYLTRLAARRNEKLRIIPQDIDPSFPTSEPEDEGDEDLFNPVHHDSDEEIFMHGQMDDLHHEKDRSRRRRTQPSPPPPKQRCRSPPPPKQRCRSPPPPKQRCRSPPPPKQRCRSPPPPRVRGKSPKPLFDRHSPRRARSPAPAKNMLTPTGSLRAGANLAFNLAGRPGLTFTKSLPRPGAAFYRRQGKKQTTPDDEIHVRGAIDIVKGLEKKRARRKEKLERTHCQRARRGQIPERKALPGRGAERMKELGLLMAGKKDPGDFVLSV